jgi:hypothetical protein
MPLFSPALDLERLRALCDAIDVWIERHGADLQRSVPAISAWSPEHHLAHVALANELVIRNLKSLLRGEGPLVTHDAPPRPGALELLSAGRLPRGAAQSPRMVRPPETIRRDFLLEWLADDRRELEALAPALAQAQPGGPTIAHQLLGPLDAAQWLRFGAVHTHHHLTIAGEVLAALGLELAPLPDIGSRATAGR